MIHQVRQSLSYVGGKDQKAFMGGLRQVYQAPTRELAELKLLELGERWGGQYAMAVRTGERAWDQLATMFDLSARVPSG